MTAPEGRMPVIFAAHGAPVLLEDPVWMAELAAWAEAMPRPRSILMIPDWAREFDGWAREALEKCDVDALLDFHSRAPAAHLALPTWEHYAPVPVAVGAVREGVLVP